MCPHVRPSRKAWMAPLETPNRIPTNLLLKPEANSCFAVSADSAVSFALPLLSPRTKTARPAECWRAVFSDRETYSKFFKELSVLSPFRWSTEKSEAPAKASITRRWTRKRVGRLSRHRFTSKYPRESVGSIKRSGEFTIPRPFRSTLACLLTAPRLLTEYNPSNPGSCFHFSSIRNYISTGSTIGNGIQSRLIYINKARGVLS